MNILNFPDELLIQIFLYSKTFKTRQICKYVNELFINNKYNILYLLEFYYSKKIDIYNIPLKVVDRISTNKINFEQLLNLNFYYHFSIFYYNINDLDTKNFFDYKFKTHHYEFVYEFSSKNYLNYPVSNNNKMYKFIKKVLENNFDHLILKIFKNSKLINHIDNILAIISFFNKIDLFVAIISEYKYLFNKKFSKIYGYYFINNNNNQAVEYFLNNNYLSLYDVCYTSIKLSKNIMLSNYIGKLSNFEKVSLINYSIYFNNLEAYDIILNNNFIEFLLKETCQVKYNYLNYNITYFRAIAISSAKDKDFFNKFLNKTKNYNFDLNKYYYFLTVHQNNLSKFESEIYISSLISQNKTLLKQKKNERKTNTKIIKDNNNWNKIK